MRGLKDKVAVVTGGLGDLGYATAKRLVEEGCKVAILDVKADEQNRARPARRGGTKRAVVVVADATGEDEPIEEP